MINEKAKQLSDLMVMAEEMNKNFKQVLKKELASKDLYISYDHLLILMGLIDQQGMSQKFLSKKIMKDPASTSRMLRQLEDNKMVLKKGEGKENKIYLSPNGYDLIKEAKPVYQKTLINYYSKTHDQEVNIVKSVLGKLGQKN